MDLTQELVQRLFRYEDGKLYWKEKYSNRSGVVIGKEAGCKQKIGYKVVVINNKLFYAHRIIFLMCYGFMPKGIDHIDGDNTNNCILNLREANQSQNMSNTGLRSNNKSGVKGVCWDKDRNLWTARVAYNKKVFNVGRFENIKDAELAVKAKRKEIHGEFARST